MRQNASAKRTASEATADCAARDAEDVIPFKKNLRRVSLSRRELFPASALDARRGSQAHDTRVPGLPQTRTHSEPASASQRHEKKRETRIRETEGERETGCCLSEPNQRE